MTFDQRQAEVEATWRALMDPGCDIDTPEAEELRRLFLGEALSPQDESC